MKAIPKISCIIVFIVAGSVSASSSQNPKALAPTSPQAQSPQAQSPQAQSPQAPNPGSPTAKPEGDEQKSLDDLLGIGESDSKKASAESGRTQKETLQRILSEKEAKNTLEETVEGMRRSATLLSEKDSGTAVQRVQEDVLARLDALIASAQQQQQQQQSSSGSSSSSSSGEKPKGSQQPKGGKGQKQSESAASEEKRREEAKKRASQKEGEKSGPSKSQPTGDRAGESPPSVDPIEGGVIQETDEEWGSLPPRTREIIRQGVREKMSSVYRRWTEAYYRRIAEESKP